MDTARRRGGHLALRPLLALLALAAAPAASAVPPLVIGDVPTADAGTLEVYAGVERIRSGTTEWAVPADELVLGVTSRLELTLEAPWLVEPGGRGLGDLTLGAKAVLVPEAEAHPGLSASLEWKLANGSPAAGTGSGAQELGLLVRAQRGFGALTLIGDAGYALVGDARVGGVREARRDTGFLGAGATLDLPGGVTPLADLYWRSADVPGEPARLAADVGLKLHLPARLAIQGAVGRSLRRDALGGPDLRAYLGLKWELPVF
ncbi:MAG TPA: hypothetical protein VFP50_17370 [Anaeromyxobacteraceae bacterium]|nr:hypothetical protein [Anaeromyxobacteraceae bacterium]